MEEYNTQSGREDRNEDATFVPERPTWKLDDPLKLSKWLDDR